MQTTIELPDDLARHIETRAAQSGQTVQDVIGELLERGLASEGEAAPLTPPTIKFDPQTGVPFLQPTGEVRRKLTIAEALALDERVLFLKDVERPGVPLR